MTAVKSHKALKREDSFLQKFSNRYGYRGLGAKGKFIFKIDIKTNLYIFIRSSKTKSSFKY
jgi:hypothetical protein